MKIGAIEYLNTTETAKRLGVHPRTLENERTGSGKPRVPCHTFGRAVFYRAVDVDAYLGRGR